ncbi:GTPase HflX [bacterium HR26]|nr:GTPase HflX [bacterium HR26]
MPAERALLVGVQWQDDGWDIQSSMEELAQLAETAGLRVVGAVTQRLDHPNGKHYVGAGKLAEIKALRDELAYDVLLVNDELTPAQLRNLEDELQVKVLDRTALILDIFARRAQTHEGRLQVELAQLEYRLPRLTRMWTHLSRQAVGGVGLRGPGETQLEIDRRQARQRIALIRRQLAEVHHHRERYRQRRRQNQIPVIALVGYTNAGKSTLLNALAGSNVLAEDKLFATLDPTTRRVMLPSGREVLMTDTVGFIHKLPTTLVAAFRATLEEILEARLLLHVLDITHPKAAEQAATVRSVLTELGAERYPVLTVLNKIDRLGADVEPAKLASEFGLQSDIVPISALTGAGLNLLRERIEAMLARIEQLTEITVQVPFRDTDLVSLFHERGQVEEVAYQQDGVWIRGLLPAYLLPRFAPYLQTGTTMARRAARLG